MTTYIENNRRDQVTTFVNVTYTLSDGSQVTLDVPIFMPNSEDDIQVALSNRGITEDNKLNPPSQQ